MQAGVNLYLYGRASPVVMVDPNGMEDKPWYKAAWDEYTGYYDELVKGGVERVEGTLEFARDMMLPTPPHLALGPDMPQSMVDELAYKQTLPEKYWRGLIQYAAEGLTDLETIGDAKAGSGRAAARTLWKAVDIAGAAEGVRTGVRGFRKPALPKIPQPRAPGAPGGVVEPKSVAKSIPPSDRPTVPPEARPTVTKTSESYRAVDPKHPRLQASGYLREGGDLELSIRAELEDGTRGTIRGKEQFQSILEHFGLENVQRIKGSWSYGDNLKSFNRDIAAGLTEQQAAARTWTGQRAAEAGFKKANVVHKEGKPGEYTKVEVYFSRE